MSSRSFAQAPPSPRVQMMFAALVAAPVAAVAAGSAGISGIPEGAVTVTADPDGARPVVHADRQTSRRTPPSRCRTTPRWTRTATRSPPPRTRHVGTFPVPSLLPRWATTPPPPGWTSKNLDITTQGFEGGRQRTGLLTGIYMSSRRRSLDQRLREGISHGNGVSRATRSRSATGSAATKSMSPAPELPWPTSMSRTTRRRVCSSTETSPSRSRTCAWAKGRARRARPTLTIAAYLSQISRGASGSVIDSTFKLNSHAEATAVLLYNARTVDFDRVTIDGAAPATTGINVSNVSHTIDTAFKMRGGRRHGCCDPRGRQRRRRRVWAGRCGQPATLIDTSSGWTPADGRGCHLHHRPRPHDRPRPRSDRTDGWIVHGGEGRTWPTAPRS